MQQDTEDGTSPVKPNIKPQQYEGYRYMDEPFADWFDRVWDAYPTRTTEAGVATKGSKLAAAHKAYKLPVKDRVPLLRAVRRYAKMGDHPKDLENFIRDGRIGVDFWREYTKPEDWAELPMITWEWVKEYRAAQRAALPPAPEDLGPDTPAPQIDRPKHPCEYPGCTTMCYTKYCMLHGTIESRFSEPKTA